MRLLLTGSNSKLGIALLRALARQHDVVTLDLSERGSGPSPTYVGDPRDREVAARATAGCDAIVHCPPLSPSGASDVDVLDAATRSTYNLMTSATAAAPFVLISSLRAFERYPMEWRVTEQWAPRPTTAVEDLAPHLAECTAREVARVAPTQVIALRLGEVVDDADTRASSPDPRWLHVVDAVQAVQRALPYDEPAPLHRHPFSDPPNTR